MNVYNIGYNKRFYINDNCNFNPEWLIDTLLLFEW